MSLYLSDNVAIFYTQKPCPRILGFMPKTSKNVVFLTLMPMLFLRRVKEQKWRKIDATLRIMASPGTRGVCTSKATPTYTVQVGDILQNIIHKFMIEN